MPTQIFWFLGTVAEAKYVDRIASQLERSCDVEFTFLTAADDTKIAMREWGRDCQSLASLMTPFPAAWRATLDADVAEANRILQCVDVNLLIHGDPSIYLFVQRQAAQSFTARIVAVADRYLRERKFDYYVRYGGGDVGGRVFGILAEQRGIPPYIMAYGATFDSCVLINSGINEQWDWPSFKRRWKKNQQTELAPEQKANVEERLRQLQEKQLSRPRTRIEQSREFKNRPGNGVLGRLRETLRPGSVKSRDSLLGALGQDLLSSCDRRRITPYLEEFYKLSRAEWVRTYDSFPYDEIPDRFVYMPFNQPWDAPHRTNNPMNYLQSHIAEVVQASLPYGYELVIKEHPYTYGEPTHAALQKLKDIGVKVARPNVHSYELIQKAGAVFCVGDTSGWEAIMFQTPVIVYGARPFYSAYPYMWNVVDPNQVHHALREALLTGKKAYADTETWLKFLHSAFESSYPGNVWAYKGLLWVDADNSDDNVQKIARMISQEIGIAPCR